MRLGVVRALLLGALAVVLAPGVGVWAQAGAIPSAQSAAPEAGDPTGSAKGRKLLDGMVTALGGEKWLTRTTWVEVGQTGHFYRSTPDPYVVGFEEYHRAQPFAVREIFVTHGGSLTALGLPGRDTRDVSSVWNDQGGWEITFKGSKALPKDDVTEYENVRRHSLDVVMNVWLKQPGTIVTYGGTDTVGRRLVEKVAVLNEANDSAEIALEESTHLPVAITFKVRNELYRDFDAEMVEFSDYHDIQGIMTPLTVTRYKNGDIVSQRFLKKVDYRVPMTPEMFDQTKPLAVKAK